jgi:hypothetical protein
VIYLTECACPVGCPTGLLFLKAIGTARIFLFCHWCAVAWDRVPADPTVEWSEPELLAPRGISLPSRADIEEAGWGQEIAAEASETEYESSLWQLWAYTAIETGSYERALAIVNRVIATWAYPPDTAYALRSKAIRLLAATGKSGRAEPRAL